MIKISSKYEGKNYIHAARKIVFDRVCGGIGWPGVLQGFVVIVGEKEIRGDVHRFILAESSDKTFGGLIRDAVKLQARFGLKRWNTVHVPGSENYVNIFNSKAFSSGEEKLKYIYEPLDANDYIQSQVELILDSVRSGNKTLHFFKDSSLPAELQSLPGNVSKLKITDFPAVAALGFVIAYLDEFKHTSGYVPVANNPY